MAVELVDGALRALGGERTGGGSAQQLGWRRGDERARCAALLLLLPLNCCLNKARHLMVSAWA